MKKFIYIFLTLFAFAFTACEKSGADGPTGQLVVKNESTYTLKVSINRKGSLAQGVVDIYPHGSYTYFGLEPGTYMVNYSYYLNNKFTSTSVLAGQQSTVVLYWY